MKLIKIPRQEGDNNGHVLDWLKKKEKKFGQQGCLKGYPISCFYAQGLVCLLVSCRGNQCST